MRDAIILFLFGTGSAAVAMATGHPGTGAPEVDPASATSALALITGTVFLFRGRRKRQ